ncbi:tRNA 4-thiouridine(8) synthase ThiI [Candidatus Bathyarchaeota archaeon]|nr:tRNA 4-thiouridine(8) synthase ThiI [Candidatus Bathyarchaeota archaeon]
MAVETILVAYGELALKSDYVRRSLERRLASNISYHLRRNGYNGAAVLCRFGRIYVENASFDSVGIISNVFGVVSVMPSLRTLSEKGSIIELALEVACQRIGAGQSFAVRPKVVGSHPFTSQELAVEIGSVVLEKLSKNGVRVDLSNPDVIIFIEVRDRDSFVYTHIIEGVGGLPYGSQGRLVSLFSGGIDSPVASWLMMKRGASVLPLFIDQRPYVGESYIERVEEAFRSLKRFVPSDDYSLHIAQAGDLMARINESPNRALRCVLCKRSMYRIASWFAFERKAHGIVTGESLGQVASQTLPNLYVIDAASELPVLRPLIGFDKVEIESMARKIGMYKITAKRVEGCKVVPEVPATRSNLEEVAKLEEDLELLQICSEVVKNIFEKDFS